MVVDTPTTAERRSSRRSCAAVPTTIPQQQHVTKAAAKAVDGADVGVIKTLHDGGGKENMVTAPKTRSVSAREAELQAREDAVRIREQACRC